MEAYASWRNYKFKVCRPDGPWRDVRGVYIFAKLTIDGHWTPLYIGETVSLADRLSGHERWAEAEDLGATYIHVREDRSYMRCCRVEEELIRYYHPPLNDHHKRGR
ncbi:MAG: hypothetical protein F4Y00_07650 [Bacteroidetes bacterium SB0662_bin_6]|nr:hypothetical protein [Bacteroidetes bacterium SB0662_bin_6]